MGEGGELVIIVVTFFTFPHTLFRSVPRNPSSPALHIVNRITREVLFIACLAGIACCSTSTYHKIFNTRKVDSCIVFRWCV